MTLKDNYRRCFEPEHSAAADIEAAMITGSY
jgi:hypothetical protein